jgi:hypothetical protein
LNAKARSFQSIIRNWVWVVVFSIAFAWVESSVVVYLREIYFDGGFSFPLVIKWEDGKRIVDPLVRIEFGREGCWEERISEILFFSDCLWYLGYFLLHLVVCHG